MNSFFKNLASRSMPWLCLSGPSSPIVLSTKMSLARNIAGQLYPDKLDELAGLDVLEDIFEVSESLPDYERLNSYELNTLNEIEKDLFLFNFSLKKKYPKKTLNIGMMKYPKLAFIT